MRTPPQRTLPHVILTHPLFPETVQKCFRGSATLEVVKSRAQLERKITRADALISLLTDPVTEALLERAPRLRVVGNYAAGINNIDLAACARRRIAVVHTPGVLSRATAELTLALLLSVARRLPEGDAICRKNQFPGWAPDYLLGLELNGRHAVLVGAGRIGQETARLFSALGMTTEFITRTDPLRVVRAKLQRAQILSFHTPLTPATQGWLNADRIGLLPRDAIVLNTARGGVVDEVALLQALRAKKIFGAGLDVFEGEPQIRAALRKHSRVTLIPHLGSATTETRLAMTELVCRGVREVLEGKRPANLVPASTFPKA